MFRRVIKSIIIIIIIYQKLTQNTEKLGRYKDLEIEVRRMWKVRTKIVRYKWNIRSS
jgi:hypothetical protein